MKPTLICNVWRSVLSLARPRDRGLPSGFPSLGGTQLVVVAEWALLHVEFLP